MLLISLVSQKSWEEQIGVSCPLQISAQLGRFRHPCMVNHGPYESGRGDGYWASRFEPISKTRFERREEVA